MRSSRRRHEHVTNKPSCALGAGSGTVVFLQPLRCFSYRSPASLAGVWRFRFHERVGAGEGMRAQVRR